MHYHAHVYWLDEQQRHHALLLRASLMRLGYQVGTIWDIPIGPHPYPMYQVNYSDSVKEAVELTLAQSKLTVLLHEDTGDDIHDHTLGARWLGEPLELDLDWLREYVAKSSRSEVL
jgi:DOPA 4,5-dioxygenase